MWHYSIAIALVICAVPAWAQPAEPEPEDGLICTAVASGWQGDGDDVRRIEQEPIPQGFRDRFEAIDTCKRFQLVEEDLITWHLRFGSERSVSPALEYLARDYLRDRPPPERYIDMLRRGAHDVEDENRPIELLESYVEARESYVFLAEQHLRAAEEFRSPEFLEETERYLRPAVAGGTLLAALETDPNEALNESDLETFRTDDLEMRVAVLRARLNPSEEFVARAEAVLQGKERPHYRDLAALAFTDGDELCDLSRGGSARQLEVAEAACQADDDYLHERVVNYLHARAILDLVAGRDRASAFDSDHYRATHLLKAELFFEVSRQRQSTEEDMLRLHVTAAETLRRQANQPRRRGSGYSAFFDALGELEDAERLAQPFDAPSRFRRIAETWLQVFEELEVAMQREDRGNPRTQYPGRARHAAYLTRMLANLDAIAQGLEQEPTYRAGS